MAAGESVKYQKKLHIYYVLSLLPLKNSHSFDHFELVVNKPKHKRISCILMHKHTESDNKKNSMNRNSSQE